MGKFKVAYNFPDLFPHSQEEEWEFQKKYSYILYPDINSNVPCKNLTWKNIRHQSWN